MTNRKLHICTFDWHQGHSPWMTLTKMLLMAK